MTDGLKYPPSEAWLITAFGTLGFIACALFAFRYDERLDRNRWIIISALITLARSLLVELAGHFLILALVGSMVIFFGFNLWVPLGHIGEGVGVLMVVPLQSHLSVLWPRYFCIHHSCSSLGPSHC